MITNNELQKMVFHLIRRAIKWETTSNIPCWLASWMKLMDEKKQRIDGVWKKLLLITHDHDELNRVVKKPLPK